MKKFQFKFVNQIKNLKYIQIIKFLINKKPHSCKRKFNIIVLYKIIVEIL